LPKNERKPARALLKTREAWWRHLRRCIQSTWL